MYNLSRFYYPEFFLPYNAFSLTSYQYLQSDGKLDHTHNSIEQDMTKFTDFFRLYYQNMLSFD